MGALDGLKVADFSWVGAGPRATKDLADNGATVVKVESRQRLDLGRLSPPFAGDRRDVDGSAFFAQTNTSKLSIAIDLSHPDGIATARDLVGWADVVVENFGPGFMERIGLGYGELKRIKPDIILASVSVAGRSGPMAGFRGYGNSAAAHSGHAAMSGWPDSEPHLPPLAYGDVVAPMFATVAILAALEYRARTGLGQHVDVSQIEPMIHVVADLFAEDHPERLGNRSRSVAPHNVFPCRGEECWVAIVAETDDQWQALCTVLGSAELSSDARFATAAGRLAHVQALEAAIAEVTASADRDELAGRLIAAGVPAAPVLDGKGVLESADLAAGGHFVSLDHPVLGTSRMPAPPMHFAATPAQVRRAPLLGEHTRLVLVDMVGLPEATVEARLAAGALQ